MSQSLDALWISVSPSLHVFDQSLINQLRLQVTTGRWQYSQTLDEASSLDIGLTLLHDYLKSQPAPLHLLGHGTGGLLALLYARRHPERVKSLTLLSVGVHPAVDWQAHYYVHRQLLPSSREVVLKQMVHNLFGNQRPCVVQKLVTVLQQDLEESLSPHSLVKRVSFFPGKVPVPLLVCASRDDLIVDPQQLLGWRPWLKPGDHLWQCPTGRYFFHYFYPELASKRISQFLHGLDNPPQQEADFGEMVANIVGGE